MQEPRIIEYRTRICASKDGTRTFCEVDQYVRGQGYWKVIGRTRRFKTFPASVRARDEAIRMAREYHASAWPGCASLFTHV